MVTKTVAIMATYVNSKVADNATDGRWPVWQHPAMANFLRTWREFRGLSQDELARQAGTDKTQISRLELGHRRLTTLWLDRLAPILKTTSAELLSPPQAISTSITTPRGGAPAPEADLRHILSDGLGAAADLPVYASAEGGEGGLVIQADAIEWVSRPAPLANIRRAFAVYVLGDSMAPAYEQGDLILVNPSHPPRRGDDVLLAGEIDNGDMAALVKRLLSWNADAWKVRQFNPQKDFSLSRTAWPKAYVIVGKYRRR